MEWDNFWALGADEKNNSYCEYSHEMNRPEVYTLALGKPRKKLNFWYLPEILPYCF